MAWVVWAAWAAWAAWGWVSDELTRALKQAFGADKRIL